ATSAPRGNSFLTEELKRAALSIPWNIAEGAGRFGAPEGARFYGIARGSAMECKAIVDAFAVLQLAEEDTRATGHGVPDPHRGDAHALVPER
ncbi:MAG: four helix bundle protein, partial [Myxococcales bacterium]|nr:four helix bundle protein [Myxococcales bacterium]